MLADALHSPKGTIKWDRSVMRLNVPEETIFAQVEENIRRPLPQVCGHQPTAEHCMIVGGGWSLNETFEELRALYWSGVKIFALNGAANWLVEQNIKPSAVVLMDAREQNREFIEEPIPGCRYLLASQCHPSLFDLCADRDTWIWHGVNLDDNDFEKRLHEILNAHYQDRWQPVIGGGTVGVRATWLAKMLGRSFLHLFGIDSCYGPDGRGHAFPQALNDGDNAGAFWCAGRVFRCTGWMATQAEQFRDMSKAVDGLNIQVHGDGLIAHMLKTGAELQEERAA